MDVDVAADDYFLKLKESKKISLNGLSKDIRNFQEYGGELNSDDSIQSSDIPIQQRRTFDRSIMNLIRNEPRSI